MVKIHGTNFAKFWDRGEKGYVLRRNKVDCELTAAIYFKFLRTGCLKTSRCQDIFLWENNVEEALTVSGLMLQLSAQEYRRRIENHGGIRGDKRFNGLPWIQRNDYDPEKPAIYFAAHCPSCNKATLICTPNDDQVDSWLSGLFCENCATKYTPIQRGRLVTCHDSDYESVLNICTLPSIVQHRMRVGLPTISTELHMGSREPREFSNRFARCSMGVWSLSARDFQAKSEKGG